MVLKTYMADTGKIFQGTAKLIIRIIRILMRSCPTFQIHINDLLVIEHDLDAAAFAGNYATIPLAWFIDSVLCRFKTIVNRSSGTVLVKPVSTI